MLDRSLGLGGSDAAAAVGVGRWRSQGELYLEKIGQLAPMMDTRATTWGRNLEAVVRKAYERQTGRRVRLYRDTLVHPEIPWMLANPDGWTRRRGEPVRIYEGKTANAYMAKEWGTPPHGQIPQEYLLQVQHYMAVTNAEVADVAVLIGGQDFRIYEIPRDDELIADLTVIEGDFWEHVLRREPPELAMSDHRFLDAAYPRPEIPTAEATPEILTLAAQVTAFNDQISLIEKALSEATAQIKAALVELGNPEIVNGDTFRITWRMEKGRISWKDVAERIGVPPQILEEHRSPEARRLRVHRKEGADDADED